ncbi:hypothetical protein [Streptomyces halobius]|uniref:Uncharacterized protein n=1 Tax=Streptomyces halobius TaxID=2879846 RepID=A0ABY4M338_9ACTN|nr:hypothetical protein [Streptomyces halobius]UQA90760.1 hypothetical protein K9S39_01640 [Streptomyces halobius]
MVAAVGCSAFSFNYFGPRLAHEVHSDTPSLGMIVGLGQFLLMTCFSTVWYVAWPLARLARLPRAAQSTQL